MVFRHGYRPVWLMIGSLIFLHTMVDQGGEKKSKNESGEIIHDLYVLRVKTGRRLHIC